MATEPTESREPPTTARTFAVARNAVSRNTVVELQSRMGGKNIELWGEGVRGFRGYAWVRRKGLEHFFNGTPGIPTSTFSHSTTSSAGSRMLYREAIV